MSYPPTAEQQAAIDAFLTGDDMVIEAGAGTGKTSTLKFLAAAQPNRRGLYLAYNASIAKEAQGEFPISVRAMTMHSMAYRWAANQWGQQVLRARLNGQRLPVWESMKILGVDQRRATFIGAERRVIQPFTLMRLAMETVKRFCYSSDTQPEAHHVPRITGVDHPADRAELAKVVVPLARKAWKDVSHPAGQLRFEHDHYLKLWALTDPVIDCDYLMLDEAQDANPLIAGVVANQTVQTVAVGDACQAIYGWRGATDFLSRMDTDHRLFLSQSFRFGPAVAEKANEWLSLLEARLRLKGAPANIVQSTVAPLPTPDAVLCRSNAEAVGRLMHYHEQGVPVALVGGGNEIKALAKAAIDLKEKGKTSHFELAAFQSWGEVQDYVENDASGSDLKVAVKLIEDHGAQALIDAVDRAAPEGRAQVTVSTAHKAKGREWGTVRIAADFREPQNDEDGQPVLPSREEMMLAYVAVTRAQRTLDPSGLEWVRNYLPGGIKHAQTGLAATLRPTARALGGSFQWAAS